MCFIQVPDDQECIEVMIAVLGGADAGKSTLLGVLAHGEFDNGRGSARLNVLRHLHELRSGRTSSISHEILGFDTEVSENYYCVFCKQFCFLTMLFINNCIFLKTPLFRAML